MEEKKLTDEEIVRALECCVKNDCEKCPYIIKGFDCVISKQAENDFLDLIHRLQSKNAEYEHKLADGELVSKEWHDEQVLHDKAEIERLTEENEVYYFQWQNAQTYNKNHEEIWARNTRQVEKEKAELQKQVDELTKKCSEIFWFKEYQQAVKDTAKEIFAELDLFFKGTTFRKGYEFKKIENKLKGMAKERGVEVE